MSGILHRASTMFDSGDQRASVDLSTTRNLGNGHSNASPLKLFGQAKKRINDIFKEIGEYIIESDKFVQETLVAAKNLVGVDYAQVVSSFKEKVLGITEVLSRDHMKVAFFGRTSNGKSTVINAMLREKILPSGLGHTTNCFVQVEGSDSNEAILLTDDSDEPKSIQSIKQLAHALSSAKLKENSLIRILWPKEKCRLLKEDVVLVDSPGIDVSPDLDTWIDRFCLDADVFVLVANAESTLMQTEKNFFHKVSSKLSKPNIFILQNRWDVSAVEEDIEEVKKQHMERNISFLGKELNVIQQQDAETRVFFISAKEALVSRLLEDKGTPTPIGALQEGFQVRLFEFANFERTFEECISKSAVKTKFEQRTERGKNITSELRTIMGDINKKSQHLRDDEITVCKEKSDELDYMDKQLKLLTSEIKDKIKAMVDDVERKVAAALNEEIRRLSMIVDEFDRPFHPDEITLTVYKKELHAHIENGLGRNVQTRCSTALMQGVESVKTEMKDRLSALLPDEAKQQMISSVPRRDFEIAYRLDCRNLCADFYHDIEFRFSFGPTALMQRFFFPLRRQQMASGRFGEISRPLGTEEQKSHPRDNEMIITILTTFASITSRTTVGAMVVTGVVAKAAGWRVLAVGGALYGLLYLYERLTWTNKAKERAFKKQYVDYASSKLRLIVDLTSSNCSYQVQQELAAAFAALGRQVDISKQRLEDEINIIKNDIDKLKDVGARSKILKNKADWLDAELNSFITQYLKHDL